jgi:hypothetical protein
LRPDLDDDAETIAVAVGRLATDLDRMMAGVEDGEPGDLPATLATLQGRAVALLDWLDEARPGDGGLHALWRRLQALQQRIFILQWLGDCLEDRLGFGVGVPACLSA